ncbi:threonine synthase [Flagellimonas nanhaiensis]|uniref:Threonine synthase n=1 Tax=Flagellimonas nanhaiensis TaxID=2292706 RepID=A0A371JMR4_9FLAO|nr:threonine synthase [Allomuricauda nanhaiensis]RDY58367.1 threonine synthase [Allomuricauda nanhaiensis]
MRFYSLNNQNFKVSFKEAVIAGIAPDRGLYFPEKISPLSPAFFQAKETNDPHQTAFEAIHQFVNEDIPDAVLKEIIANTLDFGFPVVELEENVATLELFHGPTMAFKDVGARFMANCLGYFSQNQKEEVTVLVATSGDTGGAVANGFLGVEGVKVVILYPSGKVSEIQEKQLTTLGQNIEALEVTGSFDDCQNMVKTAFLDSDITEHRKLTSANSINVARWLPQLFYFLFAYEQVKSKGKKVVFSVPSGNFGNICAGMVAQKLGMPVGHFIASTNVNNVVPKFMEKGTYEPMASIATISNAMDVGDPSNFVRIRHLYQNDFVALQKNLSSYSFSDLTTQEAMKQVHTNTGYVMDPHGAVGYLGLKEYQKKHPDTYGIFLETAHPVKFLDVVEDTLGISPEIPPQIQKVMGKEKKSIKIASYAELKSLLLES